MLAIAKCRCLLGVIILLVCTQAFFLTRLLNSNTSSKDTAQFIIKQTFNFMGGASIVTDHKYEPRLDLDPEELNQWRVSYPLKVTSYALPNKGFSDLFTQSSPSLKTVQTLTGVVSFKGTKAMVDSKEVLPQQKASLKHLHKKRQHLNKPVIDPDSWKYGPEVLVETDSTLTPRPLTEDEWAGNNILFTLRTTVKFHEPRLPILFDTWLTVVNTSNIFLVTDGEDEKWKQKASSRGLHYVNAPCRASYQRDDLCCKAGVELSLMFEKDNLHYDWLCHVDDDIYVIMKPLVEQLSKFLPREEPVYFGRSGSAWTKPRKVLHGAQYGKPGQLYHFAVGGLYCLSRAMLELAKPYLVGGKNFASSCKKTREPEDVTVGVVMSIVLNQSLSRTEMIYTHGLPLEKETLAIQSKINKQIAYAYGYGAVNWGGAGTVNHIIVPNALFSYKEDKSQYVDIAGFFLYTVFCIPLYQSVSVTVK